MILKKLLENDKEVFVPISLDEAITLDESMLIFTEDSYDEYEERMDELEEEEEDEDEDVESFTYNSNEKFTNQKLTKEEVNDLVRNTFGAAKEVMSSVGGMFKDSTRTPKTALSVFRTALIFLEPKLFQLAHLVCFNLHYYHKYHLQF